MSIWKECWDLTKGGIMDHNWIHWQQISTQNKNWIQEFVNLLFRYMTPVRTMGQFGEYQVYEVFIKSEILTITVITRVDGWDEDNNPIYTILEYDVMPVSEMQSAIDYWTEIANEEMNERNAVD